MADTAYIVLKNEDSQGQADCWLLYVDPVPAKSATAAITARAQKDAAAGIPTNGVYVAVPARSWKPVAVTTETRTILKLEQPDTAA
jgi:hypothetical protein